MRFAYIDSKGKEVPLEGVEGLALRIQIGAITDDTRLYDASADRWAPAREHPIYQNLVSSGEERGKGRKGPGAGPPAPTGHEEEPTAAPESAPAAAAPGPGGLDWDGLDEGEPAAPAEADSPPQEDAPLADAPPEDAPPEAPPEEDAPEEDADAFEMGGFTLDEESAPETDLADDLVAEETDDVAAEPADAFAESEETPSFEMEGGLELEEPTEPEERTGPEELTGAAEPEEPEAEPTASAAAGDGGLELTDMAGEMAWASDPEVEAEAEPASSGKRIRDPNPFGPESGDADDDEDPFDETSDDAESDDGSDTDGAEAEEGDGEGYDALDHPRRKAPRPAHWEDREIGGKKSRIPLILGAVIVLAAGAGGAWYFGVGPGSGTEEEPAPEVPRPPLAESLVPVMERVGAAAHEDLLAWVGEERSDAELAASPGGEWLEGRYFASASTYPAVREYWSAWSDHLDRLRAGEREAFGSAVDERLAADDEVDAASRDALRERILWEFDDAGSRREFAYARIGDLAGAALDFHELLLRREEDIRYDPASSGLAQDPILEVTTSDPALRTEMNAGIDRVLGAIAESGARPPLTTENLVESLEGGLRGAEPF